MSDTFAEKSESERLASYICELHYERAPSQVQQAVRNLLLYNLTMGLAGVSAGDSVGKALCSVARSPGRSMLIGMPGGYSAADAAFVNASLITARGQNDTHPAAVSHIGCVVIPAVLALAQERDFRASDILTAILVGYESTPKLGRDMASASSARGFRSTSLYSVLGAVAATARLLGLDPKRTAHALAIGTNFAAGTMQCWAEGTPEWRLQVANASRAAINASLLAEQEMTGARFSLDGGSGFFNAYCGKNNALDLSGWDILEVTLKLYPGCAFNQAPVHALRKLLARDGVRPGDVSHLAVEMNPTDAAYPGIKTIGPFAARGGAIMSAPFMIAATLRDGMPKAKHFEQEFGTGPLHELSKVVKIIPNESCAPWCCRIDLTTKAGSRHTLSFDERRPFVLSWQETLDLGHEISTEWDIDDREIRFRELSNAIMTWGDNASVDELLAFSRV